jgi:hypothetical protein
METPPHHVFKAEHLRLPVLVIILIHHWVNSSKALLWETATVLIRCLADISWDNVLDVAMKKNVIFACQGTY